MYDEFLTYLQGFPIQESSMSALLQHWVEINSGSENLFGLNAMSEALQNVFAAFGCKIDRIPLPPRETMDSAGNIIAVPVGEALYIVQRPELKRRIFLSGHMDTVYQSHSTFQNWTLVSETLMRGPGGADMKGGLVVLLNALTIFESSPWAKKLGWDLLITPDEEIGSQSSEDLILKVAGRCESALIFEPAFSDGHLVSSRKGSANYSVVCRGKAAHAGRDFHLGRNAITTLAQFITLADGLNYQSSGTTTINIGRIEGGSAVNIVPDLAVCKLNVRSEGLDNLVLVDKALQEIAKQVNQIDGIQLKLHQESFRAPKPFDSQTERLFYTLKECGQALGIDIDWRPSGGVCDGNIVAMAGIPCIDTLGAVGGNIHTHEEYVDLDSLPQRAKLAALLMMRIAIQDNTR